VIPTPTGSSGREAGPEPDGSVWPCPPTLPGGPDWFAAAVAHLVARHTERDDTVLLLAAPHGRERPGRPHPLRRAAPGDSDDDRLEAAAGIVRTLRRRPLLRVPLGTSPDPDPALARRGPGSDRDRTRPEEPGPTSESESGPGRVAGPAGPDPAARLVIVALEPVAAGWAATVPWTALLPPAGTLAVITWSDTRWGRLVDATLALDDYLVRAGLVGRDRIVLLTEPLPAGEPVGGEDDDAPPRPLAGRAISRPAHADLLLYTPAPTTQAGGPAGVGR